MLSLEATIEKIKQLPPEQQQEVFKFVEFIDFKQQQETNIENLETINKHRKFGDNKANDFV